MMDWMEIVGFGLFISIQFDRSSDPLEEQSEEIKYSPHNLKVKVKLKGRHFFWAQREINPWRRINSIITGTRVLPVVCHSSVLLFSLSSLTLEL